MTKTRPPQHCWYFCKALSLALRQSLPILQNTLQMSGGRIKRCGPLEVHFLHSPTQQQKQENKLLLSLSLSHYLKKKVDFLHKVSLSGEYSVLWYRGKQRVGACMKVREKRRREGKADERKDEPTCVTMAVIKGGAMRDKTASAIATMRTKACIVLVAAGLIAAVVMMTRGNSSFGGTLQNSNASSAGLMKYISTMGSAKGEPSVNIGEYRRERMEAYLSERAKCDDRSQSTGWVSVDMDGTDVEYDLIWRQKQSNQPYRYDVAFSVCEVEDESTQSGWIFTRVGPHIGRGGYDWFNGGIHHVPRNPDAKFITAKMFAPITPDGRILGYPPVHTHHVHYSLDSVQHFLDSHGDSICSKAMGGTACYLREEPAGYGLPLLDTDEYTLDFMLNDVREPGSPALTFYLETSVRWSSDMTLTPVSRANLRMHDTKHSYKTVLLPLQEESVVWNTGKWLVDGKVIYSPKDQTPWIHSHRSFLKGMWAFAASPEELGLTLDLLEQTPQESVPEGSVERSNERDMCWMPRTQDAEAALFDKIKNSKAGMEALRCWLNPSNEEKTLEFVKGTDTSLQYPEAWQQNWEETWYDRVGQVHCDPWSFKKGDNYTIVAINGLRDELADLGKPNLQHIGFKLEYESFGTIGPNYECYSPYSLDWVTEEEGLIDSVYKFPVSYMRCFNREEQREEAEKCSETGRDEFAKWYYKTNYEATGEGELGAPDPGCEGLEGGCNPFQTVLKRKLKVGALERLKSDEFNISNAKVVISDHLAVPFGELYRSREPLDSERLDFLQI